MRDTRGWTIRTRSICAVDTNDSHITSLPPGTERTPAIVLSLRDATCCRLSNSVTTAQPRGERMPQQPVQSRSGTISVLTTERGLPVALRLDAVELKKPPEQLACDIMALC